MGLFLIFNLNEPGLWFPSNDFQLFIHSVTLLATFFLPLLSAIVMFKLKWIGSLEMKTKEERKIPYLASAVFFFTESYLLMRWDIPVLIQAMMMGSTLLILLTLIINIFWMISAHMVAIGGICGMMIAVSYRLQINIHFTLIALFLTAGLVAFSRLKLSAHSPAQVYAGFFLGVFVQLMFLLAS
ncbi:MAG: hypothetical protein EPN85_11560 [Bacteroidetes bacterium]|nr:MAG: hypothetical protein EPN85_11560 [Bacteroidota bacterium]